MSRIERLFDFSEETLWRISSCVMGRAWSSIIGVMAGDLKESIKIYTITNIPSYGYKILTLQLRASRYARDFYNVDIIFWKLMKLRSILI